MRVCWYSNAPWTNTGYGRQTSLVLERMAARYGPENVACAANYGLQGTAQRWNGIRVYPGGNAPYSDDVGPIHAMHFFDGKPGLAFVLFDVYVLQNPAWAELNLAAWVPVDHEPCPPKVVEWFQRTGATPIAMSQFGQKMLRDQDLDALYVPHSVDCDIYRPVEDARTIFGLPEERFIVGMVANNKNEKGEPSRKGFSEAFTAFARFHRTHPDSLLYVHADEFGFHGVDLHELAALAGISDAVAFADPYELIVGIPDQKMAAYYSAFDVLLSPSYGEGFGIPVIEAQACGTPVIVNDFSAQPELVGAGWTVGGQPWADMNQRAWFQAPNVEEIVVTLEDCYDRSEIKVREDRNDAIAKASEFHTPRVWDTHWLPTLDALECRLPAVTPIST